MERLLEWCERASDETGFYIVESLGFRVSYGVGSSLARVHRERDAVVFDGYWRDYAGVCLSDVGRRVFNRRNQSWLESDQKGVLR